MQQSVFLYVTEGTLLHVALYERSDLTNSMDSQTIQNNLY